MQDDVLDRVARRVAEVLALDRQAILPGSRLMEELGADSLDLVELMYLIEQEFEITLDKNDLSLTAQLGLSEEEIHENEVLRPAALALLRQRFPGAGSLLVDGALRGQLAALLTVEEVARAVRAKLGRSG